MMKINLGVWTCHDFFIVYGCIQIFNYQSYVMFLFSFIDQIVTFRIWNVENLYVKTTQLVKVMYYSSNNEQGIHPIMGYLIPFVQIV
jgi:hypothetical protein